MALLIYKCSDYDHTAEREQYRIICKLLKSYFSGREDLCIFIANYNIFDCELDGILIKSDAIISIEFKNYGGTISATDNGQWKLQNGTVIKGGSRKTVYQQARINHASLKRGLKEGGIVKNAALKQLPAIVVFNQPINLDNHLSPRTQSWLHVCDNDHFLEKVHDITCPDTDLSNDEILGLIKKLALDIECLDKEYSNSELVEQQPSSLLDEAIEPSVTVEVDDSKINGGDGKEKQEITRYAEQILSATAKNDEWKLKVYYYNELKEEIPTFKPAKEYVVFVKTNNAPALQKKLSSFLGSTDVCLLDNELLCWESGEQLPGESVVKEAVMPSEESMPSNSHKDIVRLRKARTILPHWLDEYLFQELGASYMPRNERFEYNLDLSDSDIKIYLGTYFPRSYSEMFCIADNLFHNEKYLSSLKGEINILDIGCGTGGELIGLLTTINKYCPQKAKVNIYACDGNSRSMQYMHKIVNAFALRFDYDISVYCDSHKVKTVSDLSSVKQNFTDIQFDYILCCKMGGELKSHGIINDAYYQIVDKFSTLLKADGVFLVLDITTKNEKTGMFLPQEMSAELNAFTSSHKEFCTLIPKPCGEIPNCQEGCFMQQTFKISHSKRQIDASKICYWIICRHKFKNLIIPNVAQQGVQIINSNKYENNDPSGFCIKTKGNKLVDAFNINS